jgi:ankyrin repeat protein
VDRNSITAVWLLTDEFPEDLDKRDEQGYTPLRVAAETASLEMVLLLAIGRPQALLASSTVGRSTPLHLAAERSDPCPEKVWHLASLERQALCQRDALGLIPLHRAVNCGKSLAVVRLLALLEPTTLRAAAPAEAVALHVAAMSSRIAKLPSGS